MVQPVKTTSIAGDPFTGFNAVIANGASLSGAIDLGQFNLGLGGQRLARIVMPAAWTAANLSFQVSADGVTYNELMQPNGAAALVVTAAASVDVPVNRVDWSSIRYLKVRSGTSGTPVNQGAQRTINLVTMNTCT